MYTRVYMGSDREGWKRGEIYEVFVQHFYKSKRLMVWQRGVSEPYLITFDSEEEFNITFRV